MKDIVDRLEERIASLERQLAETVISSSSVSNPTPAVAQKTAPSPSWFNSIAPLAKFTKEDFENWETALQDGFAASSTSDSAIKASIAITRTTASVRKYIKSLDPAIQKDYLRLMAALSSFCCPDASLEQGDILDDIKALRQSSNSARQFVSNLLDIKIRAEQAHINLGDRAWSHTMLTGLSDRTAARIITNSEDLSNFQDVLTAVLKTDINTTRNGRRGGDDFQPQQDAINAAVSAALKAERGRQQQRLPRSQPPIPSVSTTSHFMGNRRNATCPDCGKRGHTSSRYYKCEKFNGTVHPRSSPPQHFQQGNQRAISPHKGGKCYNCHKPGHFANKCPHSKCTQGFNALVDDNLCDGSQPNQQQLAGPSSRADSDLFTF